MKCPGTESNRRHGDFQALSNRGETSVKRVEREPTGRNVDHKSSRPSWLAVATAHLRKHYPHDGLAESCLWQLHASGFDFDVLDPLRRVSGVEVLR